MNGHLRIVGVPGSPYSRKLRAVLRYRRIPYAWITQGSPESRRLPPPPVALLPQLFLPQPDGGLEVRIDSTPLIRQLEDLYPGRAVIPSDPALAFVDALLEDFADEWLTKAMFHYRWAYAPDIAKAAAILPRWFRTDAPEAEAVAAGRQFADRQIGRLKVVGSTPTTAPTIEASYLRLLTLLDARLSASRFLFGDRPAAADFALYGQLTQLVGFDPTPSAIALDVAPRVTAWVDVVEDLSGLEPDERSWLSPNDLPDTIRALLDEVGRVYVPFLLANADALTRGANQVECVIDGQPYSQRPFPYQAKCLAWLRADYAQLGSGNRQLVDAILRQTGCARLFSN